MTAKKFSTLKLPSLKKEVEWKSFFSRNPRRFILPSAGILICLILILFVLFPVLQKIKAMKQSVKLSEARLNELASLGKRYKELKEFNDEIDQKISNKGTNFELLSFLEEVAKRIGIVEKITSMKPTNSEPHEYSVSVVLKNLSTQELTDFLYQLIYSGKVLSVKKMHLKTLERGPKSLEASLVISTLKLPQKYSPS
jgi:hypothetical protein